MTRFALLLSLLPALALAQGIPVKDGTSGSLANVDTSGSLAVRVTNGGDGGVSLFDSRNNQIRFADDGRIDTGRDIPMFRDVFEGTAVSAFNKWIQSLTTMTVAVANGALTLNSSAITTINTYANFTTNQKFRPAVDGRLMVQARVRPVNLPQTNATAEVGLGNATTNTAQMTDGAFFRWNASGGFECVLVRSSTETSVTMTAPTANVYSLLSIMVNATDAWCTVETPSTNAKYETRIPLDSAAPSAFGESPGGVIRLWTSGSAPALAPQLLVGTYEVVNRVVDMQRPMSVTNSVQGHGIAYLPTTGLQAANFTNSTAPVSVTLSNTAPGYTTLGGRFQFAAVVGAATDYDLFSFTVPTSFRLVVTGIDISTCNSVVAVATTPTSIGWGLTVNNSATGLNTADSTGAAPTQAPRRVAIGEQGFIVGAAAGQCAPDIVRDYSNSPFVIDSGHFFNIITTVWAGTATATEVFRGSVTVHGYFEY